MNIPWILFPHWFLLSLSRQFTKYAQTCLRVRNGQSEARTTISSLIYQKRVFQSSSPIILGIIPGAWVLEWKRRCLAWVSSKSSREKNQYVGSDSKVLERTGKSENRERWKTKPRLCNKLLMAVVKHGLILWGSSETVSPNRPPKGQHRGVYPLDPSFHCSKVVPSG